MIVYNKLVRDRIPEIIAESGKQCSVKVLDDETYLACLHQKLGEELQEHLASQGVEELADLVEVVHAILAFRGISPEQFERIRLEKREARGGFSKRLFLLHVSAPQSTVRPRPGGGGAV